MSKIARYQGNVRAFASDAQGMERTVFGRTNQADDLTSQITASFLRGWGIVGASEHPSLEDFNAAMYAMSQFIAYQHQMGVPEWHAEQEYHIGSICTYNGESYQSLQNANIGSQPPSAKWTPVLTSKNGLANLRIGEIYAPINSPSFTGTPSVPTADKSEIDFRIANTAFVAQAIANLNGGAPAVLNTLKKLASAINNDANFYSTVNSALGQKASLSDFTSSKTSTSVVGNQPGGLRFMCGYITVPTDSNGNIFITLPDTFLGGVIYFEAHQCGSSYVGDNSPFVFSSYQPTSGPTSSISFAVRAATTGVPLINDSIQLMYFVRGY